MIEPKFYSQLIKSLDLKSSYPEDNKPKTRLDYLDLTGAQATSRVVHSDDIENLIDTKAQMIFRVSTKELAKFLKDKGLFKKETVFLSKFSGVIMKHRQQFLENSSEWETLKKVDKFMEDLTKNSLPTLFKKFSPDDRYHFKVRFFCGGLGDVLSNEAIYSKFRHPFPLIEKVILEINVIPKENIL